MSKHDKDTAAGLLIAFKFIHQMQISSKLEKGKFLGLAKKTNLQLPADLRHKTETTASPLFSIHNSNYNRGLIITEKNQISYIPTFSIMNGIKHICMCGFHGLPRSWGIVCNTDMLLHKLLLPLFFPCIFLLEYVDCEV